MNWPVHSRTDLKVGFGQEAGLCEGGNCEHLKEGDQAYGYSGEADPWGAEVYLDCQACYEKFLVDRQTEPMDCHDCCREVPRNEGKVYMAYDSESCHADRMNNQKFICESCQVLPKHQERLRRDEENRQIDLEEMYSEEDDFDDDPLEEADEPWEPEPRHQWVHTVFDKECGIHRPHLPGKPRDFSNCIQSIVVTGYD